MEQSDFMVAQIRGWGHLQYLGEEKAIAIQEANARLIAAAPDLLSACKAAVAMYEQLYGCVNPEEMHAEEQCQVCAEWDSIRAAITKAEKP